MKFLVFQHVPHEHPGLLTQCARENGVELTVIEFWKPYRIPQPEDFDALMIMGGPIGVYDNADVFPSKNDEVDFIKKALEKKTPMIGFCLGSQLIAHTLGARVYPNMRNSKKIKEIGYYDVNLTQEGKADPIFKGLTSPIKVLQWHGDAFDLPDGAQLLATSPACANQAFRYGGNAYGILFHNEFTPEMIEKQIETDRVWIHDQFELDEELLKKQADEYRDWIAQQCRLLFKNFLHIVTSKKR